MSAMARRILPAVFVAAVFALAFLAIPTRSQAQDVRQDLRDQYQGKIFVLRGFPSNDVVRYYSSGVSENTRTGDWTTDGFVQVDDIRLSNDHLIIKAQRMAVAWSDKQHFELQPIMGSAKFGSRPKPVHVEINADPEMHNPSPEQIDALASRIFLTPQDSLADLVPDYWKPCVSRGLRGTDKKCAFAQDILTVPGLVARTTSPTAMTEAEQAGRPFARTRGRITPPRVLEHHDPEFSERARAAKYQGVVTLSLTVDKEGMPTNICVSQPLGYGLDAKAVETVQNWRFKPAEQDGVPVNTTIAVQVDFHLY